MSLTKTKGGNHAPAFALLANRKAFSIGVTTFLILAGFALYFLGGDVDGGGPTGVQTKSVVVKRRDDADLKCFQICEARRKLRQDRFGGDLLDNKELYQLALGARSKMISKLKEDYGPDHFSNIFEDKVEGSDEVRYRVGLRPLTEGNVTAERFKRKFLIKILTVQTQIATQEKNFGGCDCINGNKALIDHPSANSTNGSAIEKSFSNFVWSTGGHSASASHGNLYNESYTYFLEQAVKGVFGSIGIHFEGRNYAMGGTR